MRDKTQSYMWHDSFMRVTWLMVYLYVWRVAHSDVRHNTLICDISHSYVIWLIQAYAPHGVCVMTHSYVSHDSFICVTRLIHMCDMTHSYVWRDAFKYMPHMMCVAWRSVLQCVAVCCSVLRCVAVCCTATHCNTLQHTISSYTFCAWRVWEYHTATYCNTLQQTATHSIIIHMSRVTCMTVSHCSTLHHTATHCNTLHHTAPHCNTLQLVHIVHTTIIQPQISAAWCCMFLTWLFFVFGVLCSSNNLAGANFSKYTYTCS